jgi:predicted phage baseplate assembly protein
VDVPAEQIPNPIRRAHQAFTLIHVPVVPGSSRVELTRADGAMETWCERSDDDRSGPGDRHYVLDAERGTIRFGDGRRGRALPDAAVINRLVVRYRVGGGAAGNVAPATLSTIVTSSVGSVTVSQPAPACGGAAAETLAAAAARAVREIADQRCAVTLADFERRALMVPGCPVARAHAIAGFHPLLPCVDAAGTVTVVIVPPCVDRRRDPTEALCRAVGRHLDRFRPIACELHVIAPRYTELSVRATLHVLAGAAATAAEAGQTALRRFFHPLTGGPHGTGWPVGRSVYRSEVLALLSSIAGVVYVTDVELSSRRATDATGHRDTAAEQRPPAETAACGNVDICAHGLLVSGTHTITVREAPAGRV